MPDVVDLTTSDNEDDFQEVGPAGAARGEKQQKSELPRSGYDERERASLEGKLRESNEEKTKLQARVALAEQAHREANKRTKELEKEVDMLKVRSGELDKLVASSSRLQDAGKEKEREIARLDLENKRTVSQLEGKTAEVHELKGKLAAEKNQTRLLEQKILQLEQEAGEFPKQKQQAFEDGRRAGEQKEDEERCCREKEQRRVTILQNQLAVKEKELARLTSEQAEKGKRITKLHSENKDLQAQLRKLDAKMKDQSVERLKAENQQLKNELQDLRLKAVSVTQLKERIRKLESPTMHRSSMPRLGPPHVPALVSRVTHFASCYMFGRGSPKKLEQRGRDTSALPYDDAFGATSTCLVLCDGVGGGKEKSGLWARECVRACLEEFGSNFSRDTLPRPGEVSINAAQEIVDRGMKALQGRHLEMPQDKATTTLLTLKLKSQTDARGQLLASIDACEIGDSRWALFCWDERAKAYKCMHLAEAHMHLDCQPPAPYQIRHPKQKYGQTADFYFQDKVFGKQVLHSVPVQISSIVDRNPIVVAGSDGLWDNLLGSGGDLSSDEESRKLKTVLTQTVNGTASICCSVAGCSSQASRD